MRRILLDYSPFFIPLCLLLGAGYAYLLYYFGGVHMTAPLRFGLFSIRSAVVAALAFLLLGPTLKYVRHEEIPPTVVVLVDNSASVGALPGSKLLLENLAPLQKRLTAEGYRVLYWDLDNKPIEKTTRWEKPTTDLTAALRHVVAEFEGQHLTHIALYTDGIFNRGTSPIYFPSPVPISTIGVGDANLYPDITIKSLSYNKIAYQGSRFPLRAQIICEGLPQQTMTVALYHDGKEIARQKMPMGGNKTWVETEFIIDVDGEGLQTYTVRALPHPDEKNADNNAMAAHVDVIKGKKKIWLIAGAPHPDVRTLKEVIEKNASYELHIVIPQVTHNTATLSDADLVIFHGAFGGNREIDAWAQKSFSGTSSLFFILNSQIRPSDVPPSLQIKLPANAARNEVTPALTSPFPLFLMENGEDVWRKYPPVIVPSGNIEISPAYNVLLRQRMGQVETDRPLLLARGGAQKIGILLGDGIWRWRMQEFAMNNNALIFDEFMGKFIQYLCARVSRSLFLCTPVKPSFEEGETVAMNIQTYNELYENFSGQSVDIAIADEQGKTVYFHIVTGEQSTEYPLNTLPSGLYTYHARATREGKTVSAQGKFIVASERLEKQINTADFSLLRKLSAQTGGKFYTENQLASLAQNLTPAPARQLRSDEDFHPLIEWPWLIAALITLLSAEWFIRKYEGY